jgi:hypothetical protein
LFPADNSKAFLGFRLVNKNKEGKMMSEESIVELDQNDWEFLENYVAILNGLADALIAGCQVFKDELTLIIDHPEALKIFSGEEIVSINLVHRGIPDFEEGIKKLKQSLSIENLRFITSGTAREKIKEIEAEVEKLSQFTDFQKAKIPKPKPGLLFWLLTPYTTLSYLGRESIHKARMRKLEKRKRKLLAKKDSAAKGNQ